MRLPDTRPSLACPPLLFARKGLSSNSISPKGLPTCRWNLFYSFASRVPVQAKGAAAKRSSEGDT